MQKKSFIKLTLIAIGHAVIGNVLALIVTISLAGILNNDFLYVLAAFCAITLYFVFMYSTAFKDGEHERKLVIRKIIENPTPNKWIVIGVIVWLIMSLPCMALIFMPEPPYLLLFRFVLAPSMCALSLLFGLEKSPVWASFVFMGIYAVTPVVCRLGHYFAYYDKMTLESLMYKKK